MDQLNRLLNLPYLSNSFFEQYEKHLGVYTDIENLKNYDIFEVEEKVLILLKERYCEDIGMSSVSSLVSIAFFILEGSARSRWKNILSQDIFVENCRYKSALENYFLTNCLDNVAEIAING